MQVGASFLVIPSMMSTVLMPHQVARLAGAIPYLVPSYPKTMLSPLQSFVLPSRVLQSMLWHPLSHFSSWISILAVCWVPLYPVISHFTFLYQ